MPVASYIKCAFIVNLLWQEFVWYHCFSSSWCIDPLERLLDLLPFLRLHSCPQQKKATRKKKDLLCQLNHESWINMPNSPQIWLSGGSIRNIKPLSFHCNFLELNQQQTALCAYWREENWWWWWNQQQRYHCDMLCVAGIQRGGRRENKNKLVVTIHYLFPVSKF